MKMPPLDPAERERLQTLYEGLRLKLLDLSRKNQLLNYNLRPRSKRFLQLVGCSLEDAYKRLASDEHVLKINALPEPDAIPADERTEEFRTALERAKTVDVEYLTEIEAVQSTGRDDDAVLEKIERKLRDRVRDQLELPPIKGKKEINRVEHARALGIDPSVELDPKGKVNGKDLQTLKFPDELESTLEKISGDARLAEQEMGLSTLFLAFGFLEWYDSESSDKKSFAPLLLLPVQVTKKKEGKPVYSLSVREGDAEANLSLQKFLEQKHGRSIPDFGSDEEENVPSVEAYIDTVKKAVEDLPRWQVRRWLVLGHFSFGRFAMYADLEPQKWKDPVAHSLVGSILKGVEQRDGDSALPGVPDDYEIDRPEIEKVAPFLIQDADASQHSALVDVMQGKNLVVQGPPGTGKSQTITNVIANAVAAGKRVLFLADKAAALRVVKNRLDRSGLGEFCLELHSDRASPKNVIESIRERYELARVREIAQVHDVNWQRSREEITSYVTALNTETDDGVTAFGMIWKAIRGRSKTEDIAAGLKGVTLPDRVISDQRTYDEISGDLELYAKAASDFAANYGHPAGSPWREVPFSDLPPYEASRFMEALRRLREQAQSTLQAIDRHAGIGVEGIETFAKAAEVPSRLPELPDFDLTLLEQADLDDLLKSLDAQAEFLATEEELEALPDLRHENPERLAVGSAHMRTPASSAFLDLTPEQAYAMAEAELAVLEKLAGVVEGALKPSAMLGLGESNPASLLPAAASAAFVLGLAPAKARRWIVELPHASAEEIATAISRFTALTEAEAGWMGKAAGYRPESRPTPARLADAAKVLRKTGLGKLFASMGGRSKDARAVALSLGLAPDPELLEALAEHVSAVSAFENDDRMRTLFGTAWAGLTTPVQEVSEGIQLRDLMLKTISSHADASDVATRALAMEPEAMPQLGPYHEACKAAFTLSVELRGRLPNEPADAFVRTARAKVARLKEFLAVDPGRWLAEVDAPFRRIAHAHGVLGRAKRVADGLNGRASGGLAIRIGKDRSAIATARKAIAWTKAVRSIGLKPNIEARLMSPDAASALEAFHQAASDWKRVVEAGDAALTLLEEFGAADLCEIAPSDVVRLVDRLDGRENELADFVVVKELRGRLGRHGLSGFIDACDRLQLPAERLPDVFEAVVDDRRASAVRRGDQLRAYTGTTLDGRRETFRRKDREKIEQDRRVIRSRLLQAVPPVGSAYGSRKTWTDMQLLNNEFGKQKRFTPVRQLIGRAGRAIQTLAPCLMMSPLSLAKFVPAGSLHFDLLVIDEASQMRPEDSLGGLLRAKQIVVVGDAKQLPPTDFFARGESVPDEEIEDDVDAESILEACEKTFGQRRRLKWHYRSRCESLIAFSNSQFYDNGLITFPMARPGSFSIELVRVDGHYQGQRNAAEARRLAEEAVAFMRHHAEVPDAAFATLGIVALNIAQKEMIEDELRLLCADDELVERYEERARERLEPLIVKNLENVQGDERDHIFISMTYGRKTGEPTLSQNFGPINRAQGHRRLNVLFTRARIRIGLFASFGSADVEIRETSKEGVHALKAYLAYAETRGRAVAHAPTGVPDSDFETEVADRLRLRGYAVDLQVGVSRKEQRGKNYRMDLAVRHPDYPDHYLAGVECDGATYHSSKSARDRDRLREEVLNSLGWQLVRVWSTDWFDNPARETDKLVTKLEQLRQRAVASTASYPPLHRDRAILEPERAEVPESAAEASAPELAASATNQEPAPSLAEPAAPKATDGLALLEGSGKLTPSEAVIALEALRDRVIAPSVENWKPDDSLLRPAMIETFVRQRISDPDDWAKRVPMYLRQGTDPIEKRRFLEQVCAVIDRLH